MSTPIPDENQPMRDALQRDAAGVPQPTFDPALHYTTMRRIRNASGTSSRRLALWPVLAATAAVLTLAATFAFWPQRSSSSERVAKHSTLREEHVSPDMPRTSLLTYQTAARQGDDALAATLDRDARDLLPASSAIFQAPLN